MNDVAPWIEVLVALLVVIAGVFTLVGALGLVRLKDFFQRMHPPALASTLAAWAVTLASVVYFSALESRIVLHAWLLIIFLAITMPVTTILLARTGLFRMRQAGKDMPPPLRHPTEKM